MSAQNTIDLGFDPQKLESEKKQVLSYLNEVYEAATKLDGLRIGFGDYSKGISDFKKNVEGLINVQDELNSSTDKFNKTLIQNAKVVEAQSKARAAANKETAEQIRQENEVIKQITLEEKAEQAQIKTKQLKTKESDNAAKAAENEAKIAEQVSNDYLQLSKAYNDAALKAKNYALTLGEQHPQTIQAVKDARSMYDILLRVDTAVGQYSRNVGNYKSGYDGLRVSFSQIARELPSLTVSAQQFFLAISNNLPMVADEIAKAKAEIAALKAEGKDAPSLFSRIGSSLLSWQTLIAVGITLLTAYGAKLVDWIKGLISGKKALEEISQAQLDYNDALLDAQKRFGELRTLVKGVFDNELSSMQRKIDLLEASGAKQSEIFKAEIEYSNKRKELAAKELAGTKDLSSQQLFAFRQLQNGRLTELGITTKKITDIELRIAGTVDENDKKALESQKKQLEQVYQARLFDYNRTNDLLNEYFESEKDLVDNKTKLNKKDTDALKKELQAQFELRKLNLQQQADLFKNLSENEDGDNGSRLQALRKYLDIEAQLINEEGAFKIKSEKLTGAQRLLIEKETQQKIIELYANGAKSIKEISSKQTANPFSDNNISEEINKQVAASTSARVKDEIDIIQSGYADMIKLRQADRDNEIAVLNEKHSKGLISETQYQSKLLSIQRDASKDVLKTTIESANKAVKVLEDAGLTGTKAWVDLKAAIAAANKELGNLSSDKSENLQKLLQTFQTIQEVSDQLFNTIADAGNIGITKQKNALQDLEEMQQSNYEKEIARINSSTIAEQDKADKLKILEAQRQSQKEQNDRKQRKLDQDRARFEKAANIAHIITSTAVAVIEGLIKGGPILAAIYGALGAAELAVAIATPIPKYAKGVRDKKTDGLGLVGEGQYAEIVKMPGQEPMIVDKPTLMHLPKHTDVIPITNDVINQSMYKAMMTKTAHTLEVGKRAEQLKEANYQKLMLMQADRIVSGIARNKPRVINNNIIDMGEHIRMKEYVDKKIRGRR